MFNMCIKTTLLRGSVKYEKGNLRNLSHQNAIKHKHLLLWSSCNVCSGYSMAVGSDWSVKHTAYFLLNKHENSL